MSREFLFSCVSFLTSCFFRVFVCVVVAAVFCFVCLFVVVVLAGGGVGVYIQ